MGLADFIKLGSMGFKPSEIRELNKQGISTNEVAQLAENGYSVAEINELISLSGTDEKTTAGIQGADEQSGPIVPPANDGEKASADYKEALDAAQKEAEELKKKLLIAQEQNSRRNLGSVEQTTNREKVQEAFRGLY